MQSTNANRTAAITAILAFAALLGIGRILEAAPVVKLSQSISRQVCNGSTCSIVKDVSSWSGTCVGRDNAGKLLIVSCGHGMQFGQPMQIEVDEGTPETGSILRLSQDPDLSLIVVDHPAPVQCFPIGDVVPNGASAVQLIGFPSGQFRSRQAKIDKYIRDRQGKCWMELSLPCAQGESGGGVIAGGRLSGVIVSTLDTRHPMARFYKNHAFAIPLNDIQGFVIGALGYQPLTDAPVSKRERPAEVPPPQLLPEPHPEPLPAPATQVEPTPAGATSDDVRSIVTEELSRLAPDIKAELIKQLGLHGADLKQAVAASVAEGKIDPQAFAPILQGAAKGAAEDVSKKVAEQVAPSLLSAVASHLGVGALAGSIGGPVGIAAGAAISLVGFFLNRTIKKRLGAAPAATPDAGSPAQAQGVVLDTTNTATRDETWRVAYARAKQAFAQKEPASIGSVKMFESLFNQYLGGLKHDAVE